jgi:hypothetical protein
VYVDETGTVANTNPVVFDSQGYPIQPIWLPVNAAYDALVKDALGNAVYHLYNIKIADTGGNVVVGTEVWIDSLSVVHNTSSNMFEITGIWDVILSVGRRVKFFNSSTNIVYGSVQAASYDSGTGVTTVDLVMDGTSILNNLETTQHMHFSILDSVNTPVPDITYHASNTGTADALIANYPTAFVLQSGVAYTVKTTTSNTTTTPTINPNGQGDLVIVKNGGDALSIGDLPQYAQLIYDFAGGKAVLLNPSTGSQDSKWESFPIGYCQPFIQSVMGSTITAWLAAHPNWGKLTNTQVSDIEGRSMCVSSSTHSGGAMTGSDNATVPTHTHTCSVASHHHPGSLVTAHTHTVTDPGHNHPVYNTQGSIDGGPAGIFQVTNQAYSLMTTGVNTTGITISSSAPTVTIAAEAPAVTINATGTALTDLNIQRSVYFDWIYKKI